MNDFHKKRYERLEKNFGELLVTALNLRLAWQCRLAKNVVSDIVQAVIEVGKSIPNKTLKGNFFSPLPDYGDLMKLEDFQQHCKDGFFTDYDGHGNPVGCESGFYEGQLRMDPNVTIHPSEFDDVPEGTTHVMWFNK